DRPIAWMFPGQGAQYVNMGAELYRHEPTFRRAFDRCCDLLRPHLQGAPTQDLRSVVYPAATQPETAAQQLQQTALAQPALFAVEYALARLWQEWGVQPQAMIGHSVGEYVAACLAGVLSLEDALMLVAARGRLMQALPAGAMLSVPLAERALAPLLGPGLEIAGVNSPTQCVVSGTHAAITALQAQLSGQGVKSRLLHTSHAFHSAVMEPILDDFAAIVRTVDLKPPTIPYISSATGTWITAAEATSPRYWADQLRKPVRFADGIATLAREPALIFVEVGPGVTLSSLVRKQVDPHGQQLVVAAMRHPDDRQADLPVLLAALGQLWLAGAAVDGAGLYAHQSRRRVPLPTYPFERETCWIGGAARQQAEMIQPRSAPTEAAAAMTAHPRPQRLRPYIAPSNPLEQHIAAIWQDLIGIEQVGSNDHFFELGGNSLVASLLVARLRETFPVEVPLRHIFDYATVAELAAAIESLLIEKLTAIPDDQIPSLSPSA
ncbi:MAG TPA: acyltransferase domain-containing protein, partial [Herpetosiphonaceae bacterium]